jgi:hypothetical protein
LVTSSTSLKPERSASCCTFNPSPRIICRTERQYKSRLSRVTFVFLPSGTSSMSANHLVDSTLLVLSATEEAKAAYVAQTYQDCQAV